MHSHVLVHDWLISRREPCHVATAGARGYRNRHLQGGVQYSRHPSRALPVYMPAPQSAMPLPGQSLHVITALFCFWSVCTAVPVMFL